MPATMTHAYFAADIYDSLPSTIQESMEKQKLMMFAQSTDALLFYKIFSLKKGKKIRNLQAIFHSEKTLLFFENVIFYIKKKNYYQDPACLSFLYGFLCHYILDSTIHPFIFYKTGYFDKKDSTTFKYNGLHTYMEAYLDYYMAKKRKEKISFDFCFDLSSFSKELQDTINNSFLKTFKEEKMAKKYYQSLKQMKILLTLFRKDEKGFKKKVYSFIDFFTSNKAFQFKFLSYYQPSDNQHDFLNMNHSRWVYPIDSKIKSRKNFDELYQDSLAKTIPILKNLHSYFFSSTSIDLEKLIKNHSYITGVDCKIKKKQKYFEF